jgi:hypothetical protein
MDIIGASRKAEDCLRRGEKPIFALPARDDGVARIADIHISDLGAPDEKTVAGFARG